MSDIKLDNTDDIDVTDSEVVLTTGKEAIAQHMQSRYRTFLGEWFLDITIGVPYYQDFFTKQASLNTIQSELKTVAVETPGVIELTDFDFDFDGTTREFNVGLTVSTVEGDIDFSQIVEV
jgi:hypothetical protein